MAEEEPQEPIRLKDIISKYFYRELIEKSKGVHTKTARKYSFHSDFSDVVSNTAPPISARYDKNIKAEKWFLDLIQGRKEKRGVSIHCFIDNPDEIINTIDKAGEYIDYLKISFGDYKAIIRQELSVEVYKEEDNDRGMTNREICNYLQREIKAFLDDTQDDFCSIHIREAAERAYKSGEYFDRPEDDPFKEIPSREILEELAGKIREYYVNDGFIYELSKDVEGIDKAPDTLELKAYRHYGDLVDGRELDLYDPETQEEIQVLKVKINDFCDVNLTYFGDGRWPVDVSFFSASCDIEKALLNKQGEMTPDDHEKFRYEAINRGIKYKAFEADLELMVFDYISENMPEN